VFKKICSKKFICIINALSFLGKFFRAKKTLVKTICVNVETSFKKGLFLSNVCYENVRFKTQQKCAQLTGGTENYKIVGILKSMPKKQIFNSFMLNNVQGSGHSNVFYVPLN
jgi:hypothetical protein